MKKVKIKLSKKSVEELLDLEEKLFPLSYNKNNRAGRRKIYSKEREALFG